MTPTRAAVAIAVCGLTLTVQQTALSFQSRSASARTGVITGRVLLEQGDQLLPVRRARVSVNLGAQAQAFTATDLNGLYRFDDLADGKYRVVVIKSGLVPAGERAETPASQTVDVSAGAPATADFRMQRAGALEGRFVDDFGRPIERVEVSAEAIPGNEVKAGSKPWISTAFTDDLGRFRVHTLPPGRYVVHATPRSPASGNKIFYPNTENADDATVLTVAAGQTIDHLEFTVPTSEASRISAETMAAQEREVANGPVTPELSAQVSGRVLRTDTGLPVAGATVRLLSAEGALLRTTTVGPDGSFALNRLPGGAFGLLAAADRLIPADASIARPTGTATRVFLKGSERLTQDLRMTPTAAIEGRMLDEFGDPAPGIRPVLVSRGQTGQSLRPAGFEFKNTGLTDDRGWFRVYGLPPGDYFLSSLPEPAVSAGSAPFSSTYYPGVSSADNAIAIHIDGLDVYDVNIKLIAAVTSTIAGVVVDTEGRPVANASLSLHSNSQSEGMTAVVLANTVSGVRGEFIYRQVPVGPYLLRARAPGMFGTSPVTVVASSDGDQRPISLTVRPFTTARGRVVFDSVNPPQSPSRENVIIEIRGNPPENGGSAIVDAAGNFAVASLATHAPVRVYRSGWVLARVIHDGRDVTDTALDFQTGDVNGLEVVLTNRLGRLSGTLVGDSSVQPTVFVFGADSDSAPYLTRTTQAVTPGRDGSFQVPGLLPGRYYVAAVTRVDHRIPDPAWLLGLRSSASIVVVTEGQTTNVKIAVGR